MLDQGVFAADSGTALLHKRVLTASELAHGVLAVGSHTFWCTRQVAHSYVRNEACTRNVMRRTIDFRQVRLTDRTVDSLVKMQAQIKLVTCSVPTIYVAIQPVSSRSSSGRNTNIVMDSNEGICDQRDYAPLCTTLGA